MEGMGLMDEILAKLQELALKEGDRNLGFYDGMMFVIRRMEYETYMKVLDGMSKFYDEQL